MDEAERLLGEVADWLPTIVPPGVRIERRGRWLRLAVSGGPEGFTDVDLGFLVDPGGAGGLEIEIEPGMYALLDALQDAIVEATAEWWPEPGGHGGPLSTPDAKVTGDTLTAGYAVDGTWIVHRTFRLPA